MVMQPVRVGQVFVPGGRPTVTYVPRDELQPERRLDDYLAERHKVLSVSGADEDRQNRWSTAVPIRRLSGESTVSCRRQDIAGFP